MIDLPTPTSTSGVVCGQLWSNYLRGRAGRAGSTVIVNHLSSIVFTTKVFCRRTPFYP